MVDNDRSAHKGDPGCEHVHRGVLPSHHWREAVRLAGIPRFSRNIPYGGYAMGTRNVTDNGGEGFQNIAWDRARMAPNLASPGNTACGGDYLCYLCFRGIPLLQAEHCAGEQCDPQWHYLHIVFPINCHHAATCVANNKHERERC